MSATTSTSAVNEAPIDPQRFLGEYPGFDDIKDINDITYNARVCRDHIGVALAYINENQLTAQHFASAADLRKPEPEQPHVPIEFRVWLAADDETEEGVDVAADPENPTPEQRMAMDAFCERLILSYETFLKVYDHTQRANGDYHMPRYRHRIRLLRNACAHMFLVPTKHWEFVQQEGQDRLTSVVEEDLPDLDGELEQLIVLLESLVPFVQDRDEVPEGVDFGWTRSSSWPRNTQSAVVPSADAPSTYEAGESQDEDGEDQDEETMKREPRWYRRLPLSSRFHRGTRNQSTSPTPEGIEEQRLGDSATMAWDLIEESPEGSHNNPAEWDNSQEKPPENDPKSSNQGAAEKLVDPEPSVPSDDQAEREAPKASLLNRTFDRAMRNQWLRRRALKLRNFLYEELQGVEDSDDE
ncbi:hypothetical protein BU16DRAFT_539405 [Lophium mytilinum]|uniref:Uncharacterized protein n=1 Tax=Lophium mytilinum TaxID=390894 RepID=A0A6A6QTE2_9PEZI|nr:hypothetical protein BU16DRAFT_539405 [Lophium mytilinum]